MADQRPIETRIARLEACFARLEERATAQAESRKDWKAEVERRLYENNDNAKKLMEERARDRAELVTLDLYNSRHQELKSNLDSWSREAEQRMEALGLRFDNKLTQHDRDDTDYHDKTDRRLSAMEEFVSNLKGRFWALGVAVTLISALVATLIQIVIHVLSRGP